MFILTFAVIGLSVFFYISGMKTTLLFLSVFLSLSLFGQSPYFDSGSEHYKQGEYQEAIDDYNTAIKINPNYALAYYNRGISYNELGRYQEAINDYNAAIKINPNDASAYVNRGVTKEQLGIIDNCIDYKKACELGSTMGCEYYRMDGCN